MFTVDDINRVLPEIKGLRSRSLYSKSKNAASYKLSRMKTQHRANVLELLVRDRFVNMGCRVKHIGNSHEFDMLVDGKRIEVKSSLATCSVTGGVVSYAYKFRNVKTHCFDKLVLIFVSPENIEIRQMDVSTVRKRLKNVSEGVNGKELYIGRRCKTNIGRAA